MAIPTYQKIMLPFLEIMGDGQVHTLQEMYNVIPDQFDLSDEEKVELLPSGSQTVIKNRIGWAKAYLSKACLLDTLKRGHYKISQRGLDVLKDDLKELNDDYLRKFPEYKEFLDTKNVKENKQGTQPLSEKDPEEQLELAFEQINNTVGQELLDIIKSSSPEFFEKLVVDLLLKMGYGGSRKDAGQSIGRSGDEGVDGIIKEDRLGLDIIYIQAKRWQGSVGRPEIQKFAGALQGKRARKGVFITTSWFTQDVLEYVTMIENKIILIDGKMLADFMIEQNVGVSPIVLYEVKKVDSDYFEG